MQADGGGVGTPELTSLRLHRVPGRLTIPRLRAGRARGYGGSRAGGTRRLRGPVAFGL
jgi:hypothetical protein